MGEGLVGREVGRGIVRDWWPAGVELGKGLVPRM